MFEDIGKRDNAKGTINAVREATKFIYNHNVVLSMLWEEASPDEIIRPGTTRFAINYLALKSLCEKMAHYGSVVNDGKTAN